MAAGIYIQRGFGSSLKKIADAHCGPQMMRRGYLAMKNGSWEDFEEVYRKEGKRVSGPSKEFAKLTRKVAKDEVGRLGTVQEMLRKSTNFLRRRRRHFVACLSTLQQLPLWRTTFGWFLQGTSIVTTRRSTATGGAWLVEPNTNGERLTGYWRCSLVCMPMKRRCSKRMQRRWAV